MEDVTKLLIYEGPSKNGPFNIIETVTPVGSYPDYINNYTTDDALSATDWFAIRWEDSKGARTELSAPLQGGTQSLPGEIVSRMLLRDPMIDENVALQEAEAVISEYYGVLDPYSIDVNTVAPNILNGLTLLAMAYTYITATSTSSSTTAQKFTAGLVSIDAGTSAKSNVQTSIDLLFKQANRLLGRNYSRIMQMKQLAVAGGYTRLMGVDLSRTEIDLVDVS
jgi:hypothetical protein